jgi:uncharacterized protein
VLQPFTEADESIVAAQLHRVPRGVAGVAYRCPCGKPAVLATRPRLPDGSPFPTTYYLTCPRAIAAASRLESAGRMSEMTGRLGADAELAAGYRAAHESYLSDREAIAGGPGSDVPEIARISAGGMPDRVKCLHALAAHSLAKGPGVNPLGDEAVAEMGEFWHPPCLEGPAPPELDHDHEEIP